MKKASMNLVCDLAPTKGNGRNSEGDFLRAPNGDILFAYSRYNTSGGDDDAPCDIALIRSSDEGNTWSEPVIIAYGQKDFGVDNIMSVSAMPMLDGSPCFYFLIKENNNDSTLGRVYSTDGYNFVAERCVCRFPHGYYVVNNARLERLSDGTIVAPAAKHIYPSPEEHENGVWDFDHSSVIYCLTSSDDGKTFTDTLARVTVNAARNQDVMQEPGILELPNGVMWMWIRTDRCYQYECYSMDNMRRFTTPEPSIFTSACSPMEVLPAGNGVLYTIYNPIPLYNGREFNVSWGRTPLVIRKSNDWGKTWGDLHIIEDDPNRGYCYPAMFITNDGHMLCAYCRGGEEDRCCLNRLGIMKIDPASID